MKKNFLLHFIAIVAVIFCCVAAFGACGKPANDNGGADTSKTITLVLDTAVATGGKEEIFRDYKTEATTLKGVITELQTAGKMTFATDSTFFITEINGIKASVIKNGFFGLYTDATDLFDTAFGTTFEGKTIGSAIAGAASLTIENGKIYIIKLSTF